MRTVHPLGLLLSPYGSYLPNILSRIGKRVSNENVLTRAVGTQPSAEPYMGPPQKLLPGDRIVLCTDGLSNLVSPAEIASVVTSSRMMQQAAHQLAALADQRGSPDNVTGWL